MQTNISESLIKAIKKREQSIGNIKTELIKLWIVQGEDLLKLKTQQQCSQNELTKLTGVSKGAIYNYIRISKDKRISEWSHGAHHGGQLENFNQKQLLQLTKLDDSAFETALQAGKIVATPKDKHTVENSIAEADSDDEVIDIDVSEESLVIEEENDLLSELVDIINTPYDIGEKSGRPSISADLDDASVDRIHKLAKTTGIAQKRIVGQALVLVEMLLELDDKSKIVQKGI